jgi:hypothetical protein
VGHPAFQRHRIVGHSQRPDLPDDRRDGKWHGLLQRDACHAHHAAYADPAYTHSTDSHAADADATHTDSADAHAAYTNTTHTDRTDSDCAHAYCDHTGASDRRADTGYGDPASIRKFYRRFIDLRHIQFIFGKWRHSAHSRSADGSGL